MATPRTSRAPSDQWTFFGRTKDVYEIVSPPKPPRLPLRSRTGPGICRTRRAARISQGFIDLKLCTAVWMPCWEARATKNSTCTAPATGWVWTCTMSAITRSARLARAATRHGVTVEPGCYIRPLTMCRWTCGTSHPHRGRCGIHRAGQ